MRNGTQLGNITFETWTPSMERSFFGFGLQSLPDSGKAQELKGMSTTRVQGWNALQLHVWDKEILPKTFACDGNFNARWAWCLSPWCFLDRPLSRPFLIILLCCHRQKLILNISTVRDSAGNAGRFKKDPNKTSRLSYVYKYQQLELLNILSDGTSVYHALTASRRLITSWIL